MSHICMVGYTWLASGVACGSTCPDMVVLHMAGIFARHHPTIYGHLSKIIWDYLAKVEKNQYARK